MNKVKHGFSAALMGLIGLMGLMGCSSPNNVQAERWPAYHGHEHTLTNGASLLPWLDTNQAPAVYVGARRIGDPAYNGAMLAAASLESAPDVRRAMAVCLESHPRCAWCGRANGVGGCVLNAHHLKPAHICAQEGDWAALSSPTNLISLCRDPDGIGHHGRYGHGSNGVFMGWSYWNHTTAEECAKHQREQR